MIPVRAASLQQYQKQLFEAENHALRAQNTALVQQNAYIRDKNASLEAELNRLCTRTFNLTDVLHFDPVNLFDTSIFVRLEALPCDGERSATLYNKHGAVLTLARQSATTVMMLGHVDTHLRVMSVTNALRLGYSVRASDIVDGQMVVELETGIAMEDEYFIFHQSSAASAFLETWHAELMSKMLMEATEEVQALATSKQQEEEENHSSARGDNGHGDIEVKSEEEESNIDEVEYGSATSGEESDKDEEDESESYPSEDQNHDAQRKAEESDTSDNDDETMPFEDLVKLIG